MTTHKSHRWSWVLFILAAMLPAMAAAYTWTNSYITFGGATCRTGACGWGFMGTSLYQYRAQGRAYCTTGAVDKLTIYAELWIYNSLERLWERRGTGSSTTTEANEARTNLYSPTQAYNQSRAQENVKCYAVGTFRDGGANKSLAHTDYGYAPSY